MKKYYLLLISLFVLSNVSMGQSSPNIVIITTTDHGYADLGLLDPRDDVETPNLDELVYDGVRATTAYVPTPEAGPNQLGMLLGKYPQRFGFDVDTNVNLPATEQLISKHLKDAGYKTGFVGNWKLGGQLNPAHVLSAAVGAKGGIPNSQISNPVVYDPEQHGFEYLWQYVQEGYRANFKLDGSSMSMQTVTEEQYGITLETQAANVFIKNHHKTPFFLMVSYDATNQQMDALQPYLDRFPEGLPDRRRHFLACLAAIDDGVGAIRQTLKDYQLLENTLFIFTSDAAAKLAIYQKDYPLSYKGEAWTGSRNEPFIGEKGMLSEGGIRIPFICSWPGKLPAGTFFVQAISIMDIAPTAAAIAGLKEDKESDGVNLIPFFKGKRISDPHEALFWRYGQQAAIIKGNWKYIKAANREFLFKVGHKNHEKKNLIKGSGGKANGLAKELLKWTNTLQHPGLTNGQFDWEQRYYDFYFKQ